jgi:hypothetical protein
MSHGPMSGRGARESDHLAARLHITNRLPRLALLSTIAVVAVLALVAVWPAVSTAGRRTASAGPVSNHHRLIDSKCESCHAKAFHGAADTQCTSCHRVNEHAPAMTTMAATHAELRMQCASCHKEHHGLQSLIPTDSPLCTNCHARIDRLAPGTREPEIFSFAKHPEFAFLRRGQARPEESWAKGPHDTDTLKFSHAEHLQPHPGTPYPDPLTCGSCHEPIADQTIMQPINFGKHCERCHELILDGRLAGVHVPHGSPDRALEAIRAELLRVSYVGAGLSASDAGALRSDGGPPPVPIEDAITAETLDLEQALYTGKRGCERCHDVAEAPAGPGKSRHKVTAPGIVKQWMPASKFAHGPHRTTPCRECHDAAEHSTTAGDVLVPGIARCRECHGDPGVQSIIESPCLECHRYHATN